MAGRPRHALRAGARYLIAVEIVENMVLSLVPIPLITGMTATAMPVAASPYSMPVAPLSPVQNLAIRTHPRCSLAMRRFLAFKSYRQ